MGQVVPFRIDNELVDFAKEYQQESRKSQTSSYHSSIIMPPLAVSYQTMRMIVDRIPVLAAIINTRCAQVSMFARAQETAGEPGFRILHRDLKHTITSDEQYEIDALTHFISATTRDSDIDSRAYRGIGGFRQFLAASVRDSLTLDSAPIELVYDDNNMLDSFYAVDGATMRICGERDDDVAYVQYPQTGGQVEFSADEIIYVPRNPSTDIYRSGYGTSEIEQLLTLATGLANSITYNNALFSRSSIPRGFLTVPGAKTGSDDLVEFAREFTAYMRGPENAHRIPIFGSTDGADGPKWTDTGNKVSDMFFERYMTFLASLACAVYQMSPAEINFGSFDNGSSLSGEAMAEKLEHSKVKGLIPILTHYEDIITTRILSQYSDKYVFRFVGVNSDEKNTDKEHIIMSVSTINEIRAQHGLPSVSWGDAQYQGYK